jgi:hypothetical protein
MPLKFPELEEYLKQSNPHKEFLKQQYWKHQFKIVLKELVTPPKKASQAPKIETYYEKNKETIKANYEKNKETIRAYYEKNKETIKAKRRVYRMLNADTIKERNKNYYNNKHYPHLSNIL